MVITLGCIIYMLINAVSLHYFATFVGSGNRVPLYQSLITTIPMGTVFGLLLGFSDIFYFQYRFKKRSFGYAVIIKSVVYMVIITFISSLTAWFYVSIFLVKKGFFHPEVFNGLAYYFDQGGYTQVLIDTAILVVGVQFVLQVNDKFGQGVLWNLIKGKYHRSQEETRIFMFLDIRSSTTIGEKLGHTRFFNFLNDFFYFITDPIIYNQGEIYKYVGNEVIVSWSLKNGLKNMQCIKCFYDIQSEIAKNSSLFENKYQVIPEFKAGLHLGPVTTGEIGVIKKEITHSGDVLNTTTRIHGECNQLGENLLISEDLLNQLPLNYDFIPYEIGKITLRGKQNQITLFTLKKTSHQVMQP